MADPIEDIKKLVRDKKLVIGKNVVLRAVRAGKAKRVFMADNCPDELKEDLIHFRNISVFELVQLNVPNSELAVICKKPFFISVVMEQK